ncbi:MAG TPA: hypothetical protein VMV72_10365 [Verrucomicrobiae bacterium]|nr:hypothetical protein [Verrucomicrobiae bacterium]
MTTHANFYRDFEAHLTFLYHELFDANVHFHIVNSIRKAVANRNLEIDYSPIFWGYTIAAHVSASISHLCRAYDKDKRALHLRFLLEAVRDNPDVFCKKALKERLGRQSGSENLVAHFGDPDSAQIERDIEFLDENASLLVKKLRVWSNNVAAHANREVSLDLESFNEQWALNHKDVEALISEGFRILDRCGGWYKATSYSDLPCSRAEKDHLYVVDALRRAGAPQKNLYDLIAEYNDY